VKVVPLSYSDVKSIDPPSFIEIFLLIVSPSPTPFSLIVLELYNLPKILNNLPKSSSLIPIPVSETEI
jgi:hypothetical protein